MLISGQAQLGVSATDYAARATANGAEYTVLGAKNQRHAFCVTSRADNPVREPKDLESGVRLELATINQPVLDAIVRLNDLDASKINVVTTQGNPAPLANGEVDCFLTLFTTGPIDLELQGIETYSFMLSDFGYDIFSGIYISTAGTLLRQPRRSRAPDAARRDPRLARTSCRMSSTPSTSQSTNTQLTKELSRDQQLLQARAQLDLLITPDTAANGLFWMSDDKIEANLRTMEILGISAERELFSRALLEDVYQGQARIE